MNSCLIDKLSSWANADAVGGEDRPPSCVGAVLRERTVVAGNQVCGHDCTLLSPPSRLNLKLTYPWAYAHGFLLPPLRGFLEPPGWRPEDDLSKESILLAVLWLRRERRRRGWNELPEETFPASLPPSCRADHLGTKATVGC